MVYRFIVAVSIIFFSAENLAQVPVWGGDTCTNLTNSAHRQTWSTDHASAIRDCRDYRGQTVYDYFIADTGSCTVAAGTCTGICYRESATIQIQCQAHIVETCQDGEVWNGNECEFECPAAHTNYSHDDQHLSDLCRNGCQVYENVRDMTDGPYEYDFEYNYTGTSCTAPVPNNPLDCGPGDYQDGQCQFDSDDNFDDCDFGSGYYGYNDEFRCTCHESQSWDSQLRQCTGGEPTCPPGYNYSSSLEQCLKEGHTCPPGFVYDESAGICKSDDQNEPSCPDGTVVNGDECVPEDPDDPSDDEPACPDGFSMQDGFCKAENLDCPPGTSQQGDVCKNDDPDDPDDPDGAEDAVCPDGTQLINNLCVLTGPGDPEPGDEQSQCPAGFQSVNGVCVVPPDDGQDLGNGGDCGPGYNTVLSSQGDIDCIPVSTWTPTECDRVLTCDHPDPVQCAIAENLHKINCQGIFEVDEIKSEVDKAFQNVEQGWEGHEVGIGVGNIPVGPRVGTCPAPLPVNLKWTTVEISFDPLCQFAEYLYYLVISLSLLSGARIVIGGF